MENDRRVAEIKTSSLGENGTLSINGQSCRAYREGVLSGDFFLEYEGQTIARAQKPSAFLNAFNIEYSDRGYSLKKESLIGRSFVLIEGDLEVGSIRPQGLLSRKANVSLPADIPLPVRAFVIWLTILMWKREANSHATAASV